MKLSDFPPAVQEALGYHEALRKLGFSADNIFFAVDPSGRAQVHLKKEGRSFTIDVGFLYGSQEVVRATWTHACEAWNKEASDQERDALWYKSHALAHAAPFVIALHARGFETSGNFN